MSMNPASGTLLGPGFVLVTEIFLLGVCATVDSASHASLKGNGNNMKRNALVAYASCHNYPKLPLV